MVYSILYPHCKFGPNQYQIKIQIGLTELFLKNMYLIIESKCFQTRFLYASPPRFCLPAVSASNWGGGGGVYSCTFPFNTNFHGFPVAQ